MYPVSANNVLSDCVWIGGERDCASPIILKTFKASSVRFAKLTVTGLGYFEARVNGTPVCDWKFIPVASGIISVSITNENGKLCSQIDVQGNIKVEKVN